MTRPQDTTPANPAQVTDASDGFSQYRRKQIAELRPWVSGDDMSRVSVSAPDKEAGSPKTGDMIARNPKNHDDQWLVAAAYFADNFEPLTAAIGAGRSSEQAVAVKDWDIETTADQIACDLAAEVKSFGPTGRIHVETYKAAKAGAIAALEIVVATLSQPQPAEEQAVACQECDGTGFKDKNGARLTLARTPCDACAGSGYVAILSQPHPAPSGQAVAEPRKGFPILSSGGQKIDWQFVADHGRQARANHYQTVDQLAKRGGLSWSELHAVLHDRPYQKIDENDAIVACRALEARYLSALAHPVQPRWRTIAEDQPAPPHDTPVLLWSPPSLSRPNGEYEARPFSTGRSGPGWSEYSQHSWATHWMPLPAAPQPKGE